MKILVHYISNGLRLSYKDIVLFNLLQAFFTAAQIAPELLWLCFYAIWQGGRKIFLSGEEKPAESCVLGLNEFSTGWFGLRGPFQVALYINDIPVYPWTGSVCVDFLRGTCIRIHSRTIP